MMRITMICFGILMSLATFANSGIVTLQTADDKKGGKKERTEGITPTAPYDDNYVIIGSDSTHVVAQIIITGTQGNIMYSGLEVITPMRNTLYVPDVAGERKQKLEIIANGQRLTGYFE